MRRDPRIPRDYDPARGLADADGSIERLPLPEQKPHRRLLAYDPQARALGMTEAEAVALAARWWDRTGRHLIRHPDWQNPMLGLRSGITRGLPWQELDARERQAVILAHWRHILLPRLAALPALAPYTSARVHPDP